MNPNKDTDLNSAHASVALGQDESPAADRQKESDEVAETPRAPKDEVSAVKKAEFQPVTGSQQRSKPASMEVLFDVVVPVSIELGKTSMHVKDILRLCQGSIIELERAAGEPVDILVSGKILGKGEVVVLNDRFGVRITELVSAVEGVAKA